MLKRDAAILRDVLAEMVELELEMSELYRVCAETWPADREFWAEMEECERKHAQNIGRMRKLVEEKPESFERNPSFKGAAIRTTSGGIQVCAQRIRGGELTEEKMLFISRDLEQSILERKYGEIVKGQDAEFQRLVNEILTDTRVHRESLDEKIRKIAA